MITTAAILGFGRFGAALAERLREAGVNVRAFDPAVTPPEDFAAPSACDAVRDVELVILAVPVSALHDVLDEIRSSLIPGQIVIDVASVKSGPSAILESTLGTDIPWVATHPLFGPISLARGERPVQVVVCPNLQHPNAVETINEFFWEAGFDPVSLDPEEHDREMAATHALAFFIAKGFLDADIQLQSEYAPPSVWGMRRMLESVRADAGQLYATLQLDNPYSAQARRRLLNALTQADHILRSAASTTRSSGADSSLNIPAAPSELSSPLLDKARDGIDEIDRELVALLARRAQLSRRAGRVKAEIGHGVRDPQREASLLEERRAMAQKLGLDADAVEEVFQSILCLSRDSQSKDLKRIP
ncbi:MAG: prephenate dehydrogenase/arogenate dehydrogenase family protein [Planctomycetota bacterium]|jgi:prephenate dehydrogenase|nr:prephenate dehydrogenase/arogenate dehydrogenase family protein [Planctomycetota bacterium]